MQDAAATTSVVFQQAAQRLALATAFERDWEPLLVSARVNVHFTGLRRFGSVEALAHEVLSLAYVTALERAEQFDVSRPALPWLRHFIFNAARSMARDFRQQERREPSIIDAAPHRTDDGDLTEEDLLERLRGDARADDLDADMLADDCLALVSPDDAQILRLSEIEERGGAEIAHLLGISEGAVYTRRNRARTRLRDALSRIGEGGW